MEVVNELAYVADWSAGMQIIDVSRPTMPRITGSYRGGYVFRMVVTNSVAYLAGGNDGLHIVDVSNPTNTVLIGKYVPTGGRSVTHLAVSGATAYVAVQGTYLASLDLQDPGNIRTVGTYPYRFGVSGMVMSNSRLYLAPLDKAGLIVLDASNRTNLVELGRLGNVGFTGRAAIDSEIAWLPQGRGGIKSIDITTPEEMRVRSSVETAGETTDFTVVGSHAFLADGNAGLQVLDVSAPANVRFVSRYLSNGPVVSVRINNSVAGIITADGRAVFLDVSDPAQISYRGEPVPPPGQIFHHNALAITDRRAYLADINGLWMANIEDLSNIMVTNLVSGTSFFGLLLKDSTLFACGSSAVWIFDVSNPSSPRLIGQHRAPRLGRTWGFRSFTLIGKLGFASTDTFGLEGVDLRDYAHPVSLGNSLPWVRFGSVVSHGDLAFCTTGGELSLLDIRDPSDVRIVQSVTNNAVAFSSVGNLGYLARGAYGLAIYSLPTASPAIVDQPTGGVITAGHSLSLSVTASGSEPLSYQWTKNGSALPGATNSSLYFESFRAVDAGEYSVSISNSAGSIESRPTTVRSRNQMAFERIAGWQASPSQVEAVQDVLYLSMGTNGISRLDVRNPAAPSEMGSIPSDGDVRAVRIAGRFAYAASGSRGLEVIDLDIPAVIEAVGVGGFAHDVAIYGTNAVVSVGGGFKVFDISNPQLPKSVGGWPGTLSPMRLALGDSRVVTCSQHEGLNVFNLSNFAAPPGSYVPGGFVGVADICGQYAVAGIGDYWGWLGPLDIVPPGVQVIDLEQPTRPASVARFPMSIAPTAIKIRDGLAYAVLEREGLKVVDFTEPTHPELVGEYQANWSRPYYLTVDGAYVYVLDSSEGLIIMKARPVEGLFIQTYRRRDGQMSVSCPPGFGGVLQTATNLNPFQWSDGIVAAPQVPISISPTNQAQFFRLKLP